ncbi:MAG: saccharopine dehydrogenase NADP-binding domain-containing protein [Desulfobacterales bacterium]|nr:saccharopine dehydrogenase NADP-binding domain-containing protein [Desulfobacterales bacterium]
MKVLVLGAGAQGGPCVSVLSRDLDISEVILGDIDLELVNKVIKKIGSPKITGQKIDASNVREIELAAENVDAIINMTVTKFNDNVMKAALNSGSNYIDTSFGEPELMDICERPNILSQIIKKEPIKFDKEFKDAGLTALVGCGASPGVANVIVRYLTNKLTFVNEIRIRVGRKVVNASNEIVSAWAPYWSPFRALWGYAVEPTIFENGKYKKLPIYSGYEEYNFSDSVGMIPQVYHQHQEPITLPHFIDKGVQYCDFKYTIDKNAGTLIKTGFASTNPIEIRGNKVTPLEVLMKMVPNPGDSFLLETSETAANPIMAISRAAIEVTGTHEKEDVEYKVEYPITMFSTSEQRLDLFEKFGSSNIYVSLPAVIGAKMCRLKDTPRGVIAAECLDPDLFLKNMKDMGVQINFTEVCKKPIKI